MSGKVSYSPPAQLELSKEHFAARIAVLLPSLEGGGAERTMLKLAKAFLERRREVDLIVCRVKGDLVDSVPSGARLIGLESSGRFRGRFDALRANLSNPVPLARPVLIPWRTAPEIESIAALKNYIAECRPDIILSALTYANLTALWARSSAPYNLPIVISERDTLSERCRREGSGKKWRWRYLPALVSQNYPKADAVVAVSRQVAEDLTQAISVSSEHIHVIHNPVVDQDLFIKAAEPLSHPWFNGNGPPVILGVGRLVDQKDFSTLIRAFKKVRALTDARLMILGEGKQRQLLTDLVSELGLEGSVEMPGYDANPFRYMAKAAVLVQTSKHEGLPGVLIQAMACGCPVVSTDCTGGAAEILDRGAYGPLVPVGDVDKLADAICGVLKEPPSKSALTARSQSFSVDRATNEYLDLLDHLVDLAHARDKHG